MNDPRRALQVTRYHTWPRLREQSVGEHSMQVMRILMSIWPTCPRHLLVHCLTHDIGEATSGDPPYPVKRNNPGLKKECDRIEREAHLSMCIPWSFPAPQELAHLEYLTFKLAEFIEMWEWALFEIRLGNDYAELVRERCWSAITECLPLIPSEIKIAAVRYMTKREKIDGRHEAHAVHPDRRNGGREATDKEGGDVSGQLEEARGDRRVHDDGAKVGPPGNHPV